MKLTFIMVALLSIGAMLTSCEKNDGLIEGNKSEHTTKSSTHARPQPGVIALTESACEGGDDEDPAPLIHGNVWDEDSILLEGVCVELWKSNVFIAGTGTDENGHYYFNDADNGSYLVKFIATGYVADAEPVTISGQVPEEVNMILIEN